MKVSRDKIDEKLYLLHNNSQIPAKPTVETVYSLPWKLEMAAFTEDYSQESIQGISDHIGYYLGLLHSVKVTIGIETSEHLPATVAATNEPEKIGLYRARGGYQREIQLTKKFRFELKHVLATLAHESMHNYLYNKGIRDQNQDENEILTDVSAAYFGLGQLLLSGYKPITWTDQHWSRGNEYGHTTHTCTMGYVPHQMIKYAIYRSAILRQEKDFIRILPFYSRPMLRYHLWRKSREDRKLRNRMEQIIASLRNSRSSYARITQVVQSTPMEQWSQDIPADAGKALVGLFNDVTAQAFPRRIDDALKRVEEMENRIDPDAIKSFHGEALDLSHQVSQWNQIVQSYGTQRQTL